MGGKDFFKLRLSSQLNSVQMKAMPFSPMSVRLILAMSEKELEEELVRLKEELKEWKTKYEEAVKARKEIESKLSPAAATDEVAAPVNDDEG